MPVKPCQKDNKPGFKWGDEGTCYTYTAGDEESRERAKEKAIEQGQAIHANESSKVQALIFDKTKFTKVSALNWARSHDFNYNTIRETKNTYRIRQFPPEKCDRSGGMTDLDDGVQAYVCILK